jgi:hypothetical protein
MNEPIKVFISYAHKDDALRQEFLPHLASAQKEGLIEIWHDREIRAGVDWAKEIDENLESADIILFLVSSDFINSQYCSGIEMARAIERHKDKTACAIPIIIRFSDWTSTRLGELQAIPRDNKPVTDWGDNLNNPIERDEPWSLVVKEISRVAQDIRKKRNDEASQAFRAKAERYYQDGAISPAGREILEIDKQALGLSEQEAVHILAAVAEAYQQRLTNLKKHHAEVYQQHQANLERYRRVFVAELAGQESFRADQRVLLQELQAALGISAPEVKRVEEKALAERDLERQQVQASAHSQEAQKLLEKQEAAVQREQNLQEFREELQRAVQAEYPLSNHVESGLRNFQLSLNLTDPDVASIKADILAIPEAAYQEQVRQKDELERLKQTELEQQRQIEKQTDLRQSVQQITGRNVFKIVSEAPVLQSKITKTVKIFLASSSELKGDREDLERLISRENKEYIKQGIFLQLELWEDFIDAISETRLQDEYNKIIRESDIFISLFHTKVGKYTEEEFQKALDAFRLTGKPKIYTYFKNEAINLEDVTDIIVTLLNFKKKLSDLGHFYTRYENIEDLQYKFTQQLKKIIPIIMGDSSPIAQPLPEKSGYQQSILQEVENNLLDIVLESEKGIDYRNLRDLLKEKKWRESDEETLKVMLKATNRESWLNSDSLKDFPSKDLKTIDSMWVSASDGQFGFSVQKKIWEECGSPTSYNKEWVKFCNLVGWYKGEIWLDYQELKFTLDNSYQGELPLAGRATGTGFERVFNFVQREVAILSRQDL